MIDWQWQSKRLGVKIYKVQEEKAEPFTRPSLNLKNAVLVISY